MSTQDVTIVTSKHRLRLILEEVLPPIVKQAVRELLPDKENPESKNFLTNAEACQYLGLAKTTLARYRTEGRIPFHKLGSNVYYKREDLEAILEKGRVTK